MWQGWINGILGLWLIVAAFVVTGSQTGNMINGVIIGIVLLVLGLFAAIRRKIWNDWLVAIFGIWMFRFLRNLAVLNAGKKDGNSLPV